MKKDFLLVRGYVFLFITIIFFSTYEVVSKTIVNSINAYQINFIRFFLGGLILFVILAIKKDLKIGKREFVTVILIGLINVVISMNLIQLSLYVPGSLAAVVAVIFSSNPVFVMIFSAIIDKEKIRLFNVIGLITAFTGIVIVFADEIVLGVGGGLQSPILALLSSVFYGLYTVLGRKLSVKMGSLKMNAYSFLAGSIILLPLMFSIGVPIVKFNYSAIWQVLYLSIVVTGVGYFLYFKGLSIVGASKGSLTFFFKPVIAANLAIIFLGEKPSINLFIGIILILLGILLATYWQQINEKIQTWKSEF